MALSPIKVLRLLNDQAMVILKSHHAEYVELVQACLRNRIKVQSTELLCHALTILVTNGWGRSESPSFGYQALDYLTSMFSIPLENAQIHCSLVQEWDIWLTTESNISI